MRHSVLMVCLIAASALFGAGVSAHAFELNGAWTGQAEACKRVFAKEGNTISFAKDSELYGAGFIVDGNMLTSSGGKCSIKARREDGDVRHLIAVCTTGIMVDQMQLSYRVVDDNQIIRLFPGMEGFETAYARCRL